jgi:hypothetical protein
MSNMEDAELLNLLINARTTAHIEAILRGLRVVSSEEYFFDPDNNPSAKWKPGYLHWIPVGRDRGNSGRVKLAGEPTGPIAERVINGIEAIIELERLLEIRDRPIAAMPPTPRLAVLRYFGLPRLDQIPAMDRDERREMQQRINAVRKKLAVHLTYEDHEFAFLVRDHGMGQLANRVHTTLLSLGHSDKVEKPYLIGVFGQGGSSAFSASRYSVVITRRARDVLRGGERDSIGWSIVREIRPKGTKDSYYAYLAEAEDGTVPSIDVRAAKKVVFESGSHFCHIRYDLGRSGQQVALRLYQSLNHLLFNPILPYDLYALKTKPDLMQGTAQRLARKVLQADPAMSLDRSFAPQPIA